MQIQENVFLQYFLGYSSFTNEAPFVASLFVEIRERLSLDILSGISDIVVAHSFEKATETPVIDLVKNNNGDALHPPSLTGTSGDGAPKEAPPIEAVNEKAAVVTNKGKLLMDATVAPQNITYPNRDLAMTAFTQLYEKGKRLLGQAAEVAGLSKRTFAELLVVTMYPYLIFRHPKF